jgi:CheY-like chemotaxis protein
VLEIEGYRVAVAANGREAWDWLRSAPLPALILLDLMMPLMDGAELLALVRTDARLRSVPVVLVSAFGSLAGPVAAESQGLLTKPFDVAEIIRLASRFCPAVAATGKLKVKRWLATAPKRNYRVPARSTADNHRTCLPVWR